MEREELQNKLSYLMKYAGELWGGMTKISKEDAEIIRACHWELLPGQRLNLGCPECVKHALVVCISYYERESPKWNQPLPIEESQEIQVEEKVESVIKQKKKSTRNS